jgi:translation initiation factor IF-2
MMASVHSRFNCAVSAADVLTLLSCVASPPAVLAPAGPDASAAAPPPPAAPPLALPAAAASPRSAAIAAAPSSSGPAAAAMRPRRLANCPRSLPAATSVAADTAPRIASCSAPKSQGTGSRK